MYYFSLSWFLKFVVLDNIRDSYFQCLLAGLWFVTEARSEGICKLVCKPVVCGAHSDCMAGEGGLCFIPSI